MTRYMLILAAALMYFGCSGSDGPAGPAGVDVAAQPPAGTYFSLAVNNNAGDMQFGSTVNFLSFDEADNSVASAIPQIVAAKAAFPPEIDGVVAVGEWSGNATTISLERIEDFEKYNGVSPAGVRSVSVRSMYDDQFIYFQLSWSDATLSMEKDKLTFSSSGGWSKGGNEDRFYFMFPITGFDGTDFADGNGCEAFCHYDEASANGKGYMFTELPGQIADMWQWKASRSNPIGYIHDKHLVYRDAAALEASADKPKSFSGRKGDQGKDMYGENKLKNGVPLYMHASDPNRNASYPSYVWEMNPFDSGATFADGATIPGLFLRTPTGSSADVVAAGVHTGSGRVVEVSRLRNTGHGDDHQFRP